MVVLVVLAVESMLGGGLGIVDTDTGAGKGAVTNASCLCCACCDRAWEVRVWKSVVSVNENKMVHH